MDELEGKTVDIKAVVEKDRADRIAACEADIHAILKKYNCNLSTLQEFVNGQPGKMVVRIVSIN